MAVAVRKSIADSGQPKYDAKKQKDKTGSRTDQGDLKNKYN